MKKPVISLYWFSVFLALAVVSTVHAQQMYSWTDDKGVVHYSDKPPPDGTEATVADIPPGAQPIGQAPVQSSPAGTGDGESLTAAQQIRKDLEDQREQNRKEAEIRKVECDQQRAIVTQLEPHRRVFYTDESGETVRMDDQERVDRVADAKRFIEQNCD